MFLLDIMRYIETSLNDNSTTTKPLQPKTMTSLIFGNIPSVSCWSQSRAIQVGSRQWHLKFSVNIGHIHLNHRPVTLVTNKHLDRFLLLIDILNCRSVFLSRVKYHISFNLLLTNKYYILFHLYLTLTFHLCHVNTIFSILPRWRWRYHGDAMERPDRWRITEEERKGCENR
mgnify:CR=1 FL=1